MTLLPALRRLTVVMALPAALALGATGVGAQETGDRAPWHPGTYFAAGAQFSFPYDRFADDYQTGYGLQAIFDYPWVPLLDWSASVGWNHFGAKGDNDAVDVWEAAAGLRFVLGRFFMNGEVGWFSEVDDTTFIPGLGWRTERWEISLRTKAAGSNAWTSVRFGWYF